MYTRFIYVALLLIAFVAFSPVSGNPRFRRQSTGANANAGASLNVNQTIQLLTQLLKLEGLTQPVKQAIQTIITILQTATGPLLTAITQALTNVLQSGLTPVAQLQQILLSLLTSITPLGSQITESLKQTLQTAILSLLTFVNTNVNQIQQLLNNTTTVLTGTVNNVQVQLGNLINVLRGSLENLLLQTAGNAEAQNAINKLLAQLNAGNLNTILLQLLAINPLLANLPLPQILGAIQQIVNGPLLGLVTSVVNVLNNLVTNVLGLLTPVLSLLGGLPNLGGTSGLGGLLGILG